jgi:hypothetical protein
MKSLERQLQEAQEEIRRLRSRDGKNTLVLKLTESGLPAVAQARLRKRFEESGNPADLDKAITEERDYISKVRKASARGQVTEMQEANAQKLALVEGYRGLGLSESEARVAAGVEDAITNVTEAEQALFDAAKGMGMSEAEAKAFARGPRSESW